MSLLKGKLGREYIVKDIYIDSLLKNRLHALGILTDATVKIISNQIKGSMVIKVRGTRLVLGDDITKNITVKEQISDVIASCI